MPNGKSERQEISDPTESYQTFNDFLATLSQRDILAWGRRSLKKIYELTQGESQKFEFYLSPPFYDELEMDLFKKELELIERLLKNTCHNHPEPIEETFIEILYQHLVISGLSVKKEIERDNMRFAGGLNSFLGVLTINGQTQYRIKDRVEAITSQYEREYDAEKTIAFRKNRDNLYHCFEITLPHPISLVQAKTIFAFCNWPNGIAVEKERKHSFDLFNCASGTVVKNLLDEEGILPSGGSHYAGSVSTGVWQFLQLARTLENFKLQNKVEYKSPSQTWGWNGDVFTGELRFLNEIFPPITT